jgi:hypothetical protein
MKSPPLQIHDDVARERLEAFIRGEDNETLTGAGDMEAEPSRHAVEVAMEEAAAIA